MTEWLFLLGRSEVSQVWETVRTAWDSERMLPEHCQSSEKWNGKTWPTSPDQHGTVNRIVNHHLTSPHFTTSPPSHHIRILYQLAGTYMIFSGVETWCHCLSFLKEQKYKLNFREGLRGASSHSVWRTTPSLRKCSLGNPPKPSNGWESDLLSVHPPSVASVSAPAGAVFKGELNVSRVYRAG